MDESDAFLVARAASGDREAFSQLYARYFDRIFRFVQVKVNNHDDAEDVTSGVFLNALRAIDGFSPKHDASFPAWLFRMTRNAITDRYRRQHDVVSLDNAATIESHESSSRPEDEVETRLTMGAVHQALTTLTPEQRDVVLLRFIEGLSAREVGDIIGKTEGAVRILQFRALEAMRRALDRAREGDILG